jgi:processing peptidase subunit beta
LQIAMRVLQSLVRQQGELIQLAARAFGTSAATSADVAVASPFLRYSNPYPANIDHTPLLSSIPETQVRGSKFSEEIWRIFCA